MPVTCDAPTSHFSSGCELVLHYDANKDGNIDIDELNQSYTDYENGIITEEEFDFVSDAYINYGINVICPGCYMEIESGICFKTGEDWEYPSLPGVFIGTIMLIHTCTTVSDVVTKPAPGTGGRVSSWIIRKGVEEVTKLEAGIVYDIEVHLASYPQIIHGRTRITNSYGALDFVSFVAVTGDPKTNWIPVLILKGEMEPPSCAIIHNHIKRLFLTSPTGCDTIFDLNSDGTVDVDDLEILAANWNEAWCAEVLERYNRCLAGKVKVTFESVPTGANVNIVE